MAASFARLYRWLAAATLAAAPASAWALVTGELADSVADVLAVVVIIIVPIVGIYLFWKVHVLPEQIAERRHHPQKDAIRILCLLSLVFGGMLWPFAWLWAYTKPTLHKLAYGTDKHEDAESEAVPEQEAIAASPAERLEERLTALRADIDRLRDEGALPEDVALLKRDVARIEQKLIVPSRQEAH
ncbi:MAG: DUF3302 domain-containing protein [Sulfurifustis sp.]